MLKTIIIFILAIIISASASAGEQEWRFRVLLDDKEIGTHEYFLKPLGDGSMLKSMANFEYKLLFVKLYEYRHEAIETWSGNCLTEIESTTNENGEPSEVSGVLENDRFVIHGSSGAKDLPLCNMTFAYWNPDFLKQNRLIDVQNGELVDVNFSAPEKVEIPVKGKNQPSIRYMLKAGELEIVLWYSESFEWLALETEVRGGRRLRYELI
jgi:hypothetical protein